MRFTRLAIVACLLLPLMGTGCDNLKKIPLFNPNASLVNQSNSALEFYAQVNFEVAKARDAGLVTQTEIDKRITPSLVKAKAIILSVRTVAHEMRGQDAAPLRQVRANRLAVVHAAEVGLCE